MGRRKDSAVPIPRDMGPAEDGVATMRGASSGCVKTR